jgi:hypothetical protein
MAEVEPNYWRIRFRVAGSDDLTREAWERDEIGIWYGAWTASDLNDAISKHATNIGAHLNSLRSQRRLGWDVDINTVMRFKNISEIDWIVIYLRDHKEIGLAKICSEIRSDPDHPFK